MSRARPAAAVVATIALFGTIQPRAVDATVALEHRLGRNEVRVFAAPYRLRLGDRLTGSALPDRLDGQGYVRVRHKPEEPGEYFWRLDRFWIFRRQSVRSGRRPEPARLLEVGLERSSGRVSSLRYDDRPGKELEERLQAGALSQRRRAWQEAMVVRGVARAADSLTR